MKGKNLNEATQKFVCPGCNKTIGLVDWQEEDGPCADGNYYCLSSECKCACMEKWERREKKKRPKMKLHGQQTKRLWQMIVERAKELTKK